MVKMKHLWKIWQGCLVAHLLFPILVVAQNEAGSLDSFVADWEVLSAKADLTLGDRLVAQTDIIQGVSEFSVWTSEPVWTWVQTSLDLWETSPDIELARENYLSILREIGTSLHDSGQPFTGEERLREYIQRALSLSLSPVEEGTLLLFLAESWIRTADGEVESLRRAESILQQAADLLPAEPPRDAVHAHLGDLLLGDDEHLDSGDRRVGDRTITQAVFHYRAVQGISGARQAYVDLANEKLALLLEPELAYEVRNRYLPRNDIRISVKSRNIPFLEVDLVPLSNLGGVPMTPLDTLLEVWKDYDASPEQIVLSKRFPVRTRMPFDWAETQLRLGEEYSGGWYGLSIRGGGMEIKELLLVTTLEIAAIPRPSGDLAVWISDTESGLSLPGTEIHILDESGTVLTSEEAGENGFIVLDSADVSGWSELQAISGSNPGVLQRESISSKRGLLPWVIANSLEIAPGESLQFSVFGVDGEDWIDANDGPGVLFPDGSVVSPEIQSRSSSWISCLVRIPESSATTGPLYVELRGGYRLLLSHVVIANMLPLEVEFTGDRLEDGSNMFLDTSSLGIQLSASTPVWDSQPDYIRMRVLRMDRKKQVGGENAERPHTEHVLLENIFSIDDAQSKGTLVMLPALPVGESFLPVKVEVVSLDGDELLGTGHAALMNYRSLVHLKTDENIILTGETVRVRLEYEDPTSTSWRPHSGDLVLYRETWESRYIHRKRGNLISESEYTILPDRSLLGAAKTDYRLSEQGYVREEIQRLSVKASSNRVSVPINFERPGYYHIDFESPEGDIKATYEGGALEVWVLPETGDLHSFRSVEPRVIIEAGKDNSYECLLLMDRAETSVLMDFEHEDGSTLTRILSPETSAVAFNYVPETASPLLTCRFFIVGDRQTEFLWQRLREQSRLELTIGADQLFGVNPGASFAWPLSVSGELGESPVYWTFFPNTVSSLVRSRADWQTAFQADEFNRQPVPVMFLEKSLPLFHPLDTRRVSDNASLAEPEKEPLSSAEILSLYPEFLLPSIDLPSADSLSLSMPPETGNTVSLTGSFPDSAGQWNLTLYAESIHGNLTMEEWLVSTELPVRSHLEGPPVLRLGDEAELRLQLGNTTSDPVALDIETGSEGVTTLMATPPGEIVLPPGEEHELYFPVKGNTAGEGDFTVRAVGQGTSTESLHRYETQRESPETAWKFRLIPPQKGIWKDSLAFPDWGEGLFITASGLGSLLPELWPHLRHVQSDIEPLVVALGDWALFRTLEFQGLPRANLLEDVTDNLLSVLTGRQSVDGGHSWSAGGPSDAWLSALVLWTLDSFSDSDSELFVEILEASREFLEGTLINSELDTGVRLFALRALAAEAVNSPNARPTRIQARSFLEFLYQRSSLSTAELAMLLEIARAYDFKEEIVLLTLELRQQASSANGSGPRSFFSESLIFLALNEDSGSSETHLEGLEGALMALGESGPVRGWEHVAGMLNLMNGFYWKGEFNIDGQIRMTLNDLDPVDFMLNPDLSHPGLYPLHLEQDMLGQLNIEVETAFALSPVILAFIGSVTTKPEIPVYPGYELELFREFDERTLLTGTHKSLAEIGDDTAGVSTGDVLRMRLTLTAETSEPYAELCFPVPAGLSTEGQSIEHRWESPSLTSPAVDSPSPNFHSLESDDTCRVFRLEPFPAGRHVIEIPFKVKWAGTYSWPANLIFYPQSGASYQIENAGPLKVSHLED